MFTAPGPRPPLPWGPPQLTVSAENPPDLLQRSHLPFPSPGGGRRGWGWPRETSREEGGGGAHPRTREEEPHRRTMGTRGQGAPSYPSSDDPSRHLGEPDSQGRIEPVGPEAKVDNPSSITLRNGNMGPQPEPQPLQLRVPLGEPVQAPSRAAPLCRMGSPAPHQSCLWEANRTSSRDLAPGLGHNPAPAALHLGCPIHGAPLMPVSLSHR